MFRAQDAKKHAEIQASYTVNRVEASRQEPTQKFDIKLKKAFDTMKGVMYSMPSVINDIPLYLRILIGSLI